MTSAEPKRAAARPPDPRPAPPAVWRKLGRWTEHLLAALGLWFLVYHLGFEVTAMISGSMAPTLQGTSYANGDRVLVEKVTRWFRAPRRWEVHFFHAADGVPVAKRIVGLPGERLCLKENRLYVNGREIPRPGSVRSRQYYAYGNLSGGREVACGRGYYVLGDDSQDSNDSRFEGPVGSERFRGRVWCVLWPLARVGFVR